MSQETSEDWTDNEAVDWDPDQSGVYNLTVAIEGEYMDLRLSELGNAQAAVHLFDGLVDLHLNNEGDEIEADDPYTHAGIRLSPEEAQRLGRQLIFAGEQAEKKETADVRA